MYTTEQIKDLIAHGQEHKFYDDRYWRNLSHEIRREHHGECMLCKARGRVGKAVIVHHIKHLKDNPELAYSRYNLMPVCFDCHSSLHQHEWHTKTVKKFENEEKW